MLRILRQPSPARLNRRCGSLKSIPYDAPAAWPVSGYVPRRRWNFTQLLRAGEEESIALQHARCTGCGLCTQVCEHEAIAIHEPDATASVVRRPQSIALEALVCSQCKAPFYLPASMLSGNAKANRLICPICSAGRVHHTQRIVQDFSAAVAIR